MNRLWMISRKQFVEDGQLQCLSVKPPDKKRRGIISVKKGLE